MTGLLKGNLGTSLRTKQPVTKEVAGRFGNTVRLAFVTLLWSSVVGVLFGVWSGTHRGKWQDYTGMTIAVSGISLPSFWIGFLLIMLFAVKLRILPTTSGTSLKSLIMPSITLGRGIAAVIARFTRSSIIEVLKRRLRQNSKSKRNQRKGCDLEACFRNSMISVVTVVGLQFGFLLGGSVVTETVFAYPALAPF